jgi:hypothetical protein
MNLDDLQRKLIDAARAYPPRATVPYGFERRVINRVKCLAVIDFYGFWATALWRAAAPCVVVALVLAAWSFLAWPNNSSGLDLSQEFENTVLAAANLDQPPPELPR